MFRTEESSQENETKLMMTMMMSPTFRHALCVVIITMITTTIICRQNPTVPYIFNEYVHTWKKSVDWTSVLLVAFGATSIYFIEFKQNDCVAINTIILCLVMLVLFLIIQTKNLFNRNAIEETSDQPNQLNPTETNLPNLPRQHTTIDNDARINNLRLQNSRQNSTPTMNPRMDRTNLSTTNPYTPITNQRVNPQTNDQPPTNHNLRPPTITNHVYHQRPPPYPPHHPAIQTRRLPPYSPHHPVIHPHRTDHSTFESQPTDYPTLETQPTDHPTFETNHSHTQPTQPSPLTRTGHNVFNQPSPPSPSHQLVIENRHAAVLPDVIISLLTRNEDK